MFRVVTSVMGMLHEAGDCPRLFFLSHPAGPYFSSWTTTSVILDFRRPNWLNQASQQAQLILRGYCRVLGIHLGHVRRSVNTSVRLGRVLTVFICTTELWPAPALDICGPVPIWMWKCTSAHNRVNSFFDEGQVCKYWPTKWISGHILTYSSIRRGFCALGSTF